jgi:hypothetical protein
VLKQVGEGQDAPPPVGDLIGGQRGADADGAVGSVLGLGCSILLLGLSAVSVFSFFVYSEVRNQITKVTRYR